jgi:hypothetical protein
MSKDELGQAVGYDPTSERGIVTVGPLPVQDLTEVPLEVRDWTIVVKVASRFLIAKGEQRRKFSTAPPHGRVHHEELGVLSVTKMLHLIQQCKAKISLVLESLFTDLDRIGLTGPRQAPSLGEESFDIGGDFFPNQTVQVTVRFHPPI